LDIGFVGGSCGRNDIRRRRRRISQGVCVMAYPDCLADWSKHFDQKEARRVSVAWAVVGLFALGPAITGAFVWVLS
jgi:hypothetical protein